MKKSLLLVLSKDILNNTSYKVSETDKKFLMSEVFCHHRDFKKKVGCGVRDIVVDTDGHEHKCFYFIRKDGTKTEISYIASIKNKGSKEHLEKIMTEDIKAACRQVVFERVIIPLKKRIKLPYTCPVTGKIITDINDIKVHHYDLTFEQVFTIWICTKNLKEIYDDISDENIKNDFIDFHNSHTNLICVSEKGHQVLHSKLGFMDEFVSEVLGQKFKKELEEWDIMEKKEEGIV